MLAYPDRFPNDKGAGVEWWAWVLAVAFLIVTTVSAAATGQRWGDVAFSYFLGLVVLAALASRASQALLGRWRPGVRALDRARNTPNILYENGGSRRGSLEGAIG